MKLVDIRVNDNLAEHTEVHFVDNGKQRVARA
jgi:outer membrane usher protein